MALILEKRLPSASGEAVPAEDVVVWENGTEVTDGVSGGSEMAGNSERSVVVRMWGFERSGVSTVISWDGGGGTATGGGASRTVAGWKTS